MFFLTDEVFQKVADDFSSCALEFMQGGHFEDYIVHHCAIGAL